MPYYALDDIVSSEPPFALDSYLRERGQIPISEQLHLASDFRPVDRQPELFETLFAHLVPIHTPHEVQRDTQCDRESAARGEVAVVASPEISPEQDCPSTLSSSPPSLDSREPSLTDGSLPTDIMLQPTHHATLQNIDRGVLPLRIVPASQHGDSQYLLQLAPTVMSGGGEPASDDAGDAACKPTLRCAFWYLGCRKGYHTEERWLAHCNLHLRNCKDARPVPCQVCKNELGGWNRWLLHIADHQRQGINLKNYPADPALVPRLWSLKVIKDDEWLELIHKGRLDAGYKNFIHMHDPIKERRQLAAREWGAARPDP